MDDEKRKTLSDVLLGIGTVVQADVSGDEASIDHIIIGKRVISENSDKPWDYMAVPKEAGFIGVGIKGSNVIYFNHDDIFENSIRRCKYE